MSRARIALTCAALAVVGLFALPAGRAGSATSCVVWASLPRHITLSGAREVNVHVTLQATPACTGITADSGARAVLNGPAGSTSDFPLRWSHIGATETASFYWGINSPGVYRIRHGHLHTYDAQYEHIPFTWRSTWMRVSWAS